MKPSRIVLAIIACAMMLIMGACAAPQQTENTAATAYRQRVEHLQLVNRMSLSTVIVVVRGPFGGMASGILLRQEKNTTFVLMAGHTARRMVMPGNMTFAASYVGRRGCRMELVAASERYDLALGKASCRLQGVPVRLAKRLPALGETVYSMGHTYGYFQTLTKGIVSHVNRHIRGRTVLQVSAQGGPGNSGGPLFNDRGELVAVVVGGPLAPLHGSFGAMVVHHMALCEPLQNIRNFLAKHGAL